MNLQPSKVCDVFVMGAGIAGVMSAISASKKGSQVILSSSTHLFSGSSFYPGTWGLGLIGPVNEADEVDLAQTIKRVGCGVVDEQLVHTFVKNINPSINRLKLMGVSLKEPVDTTQAEFIPCFDHKHRNWNGIMAQSAKDVLTKELEKEQITLYQNSEVIEFVKHEEQVVGVILIKDRKEIEYIQCKSLIIASGGYGGLYKYRLNTSDILGMGQALAFKHGCELVNVEFMQMMPGYVSPCYKTIFNEKVFKYLAPTHDALLFEKMENAEELFKIRSTYGPFTSRLLSREIDITLFNEFLKHPEGVGVKYREEIKSNTSEFVTTYFNWLQAKKHLSVDDEFKLGIFFHAANGGIKINERAKTSLEGVFACGEVTGGMHGADRIGGLSTANGLVFGMIAGENAAAYAKKPSNSLAAEVEFNIKQIANAKSLLHDLQMIMFEHAMIVKDESGLTKALEKLNDIEKAKVIASTLSIETLHETFELEAALILATVILKAMLKRRESRGSHYRRDYPVENPRYEKMSVMSQMNLSEASEVDEDTLNIKE